MPVRPAAGGGIPPIARLLGLSGLLPQLGAVALLLSGDPQSRYAALAIAYAYAAIILSFLGGLWWGLAARTDSPPRWLWFASVAPSLIALITAWPWMVGLRWPGPSLVVLGLSLIAALCVDRALVRDGIAPPGWMALRVPLSLGLGVLTMLAAAF
ncbi:DUF3429 domain-containing protein [Sphingomonas sp. Leaf38]|jgi:hypothetical protein|uniref:DUF3429 domain-containing protein n=1 Tax=Sphingomonas sp. Leaf38 TaxID=1736217 RepID=UPI0006F87E56|nr:DUF3429 domain-containing protein [Sphingomonas sp. Leaf38]KQN35349.1 hypothetical protein ASE88_17345 [Sphingomonas sp. Leaf38]